MTAPRYMLVMQAAAKLCPSLTIRRHVELLERAPDGVCRDRIMRALRVLYPHLYLNLVQIETFRPLCEAYPNIPIDLQARLVLGESPSKISGGLTRAEAHAWLCQDRVLRGCWLNPQDWLVEQTVLRDYAYVHDVTVAHWLLTCYRDPPRAKALCKSREIMGPHGELLKGTLLEHCDVLRRIDLRPSVEDTFERCAHRLLRAAEKAMRKQTEPLAPVPRWYQPIRCARLLLTARDLVIEGQEMCHCVATYAPYVKRGESVIVALAVCGARSTAEIDRQRVTVRQHKGPHNHSPDPLCQRALSICIRRWKENHEYHHPQN